MNKLQQITKRTGNNICADCSTPDPTWVSSTFGILICIKCAGIHRGLGVHISRVRSLTLDDIEYETLQSLEKYGNIISNEKYLCNIPDDIILPNPSTSLEDLKEWINDKYVLKKYMNIEEKQKEDEFNIVHIADFLDISVNNPTTVTDISGNTYTVYNIITKTNLKNYPSSEFNVKRRYNEFYSLYLWLKEQEIPGLPKMPGKTYFGRFYEDTISYRLRMFNKILSWASTQAKIRNSTAFIQFLTVKHE